MKELPLSIKEIKDAKVVLDKYARKTPLVKSYYLSGVTNTDIYLKLENMQLTGSFKFRGAYNKIMSLTDEERATGVIACSAGNHAQGVALSCKLLGVKAKIVMPETAPEAKVDATRGYGAEVVLYGKTFDDAKAKCKEIYEETGEVFLDPFDDVKVMAGQGTIGIEILEDLYDVETVIAPIGGGGLISGLALALKSYNPNIKVIGVQAENVHGMKASVDAGHITTHFKEATLADGCAVQVPGQLTYEMAVALVDDIVTVTEDEIKVAMKDLMQRGKQIIEGSGAMPTAAVLAHKVDQYIEGRKTVCVISGGNISLTKVAEVVDHFFGSEV